MKIARQIQHITDRMIEVGALEKTGSTRKPVAKTAPSPSNRSLFTTVLNSFQSLLKK
ncbi:hypothetical protein [Mesorhizobium sp. B2-3-10]|uniref:hypothetical protein n=1 Tax=Mesorhizobium sp. B2-3-10 TaxID=2589954 RepID=UPI0015E3AC31|nr:hypothetical protein [Mesorhizobium sp. B2-3-10]